MTYIPGGGGSTVAPVTRSAPFCFTHCSSATGQAAATPNHLRRPFRLGVKPTRFRVHFRNRVQLGGSSPTGTAGNIDNLTVVIGKPGVDATTGDLDGTWASAPTSVMASTAMAAGTEVITPWIDAAAYKINVDELHMLGYSFNSGNVTNSQVALNGGFCFRDNTASNLTVVAPSTALTRSDNAAFLQVIIEYEHTDANAKNLLNVTNSLGDSSANGTGTPDWRTNVGEIGTMAQIWAMKNRCTAASIGVAGAYASQFSTSFAGDRWDLFDTFNIPYKPDLIYCFALASSDVADCTSAATMNDIKTNIRNVIRKARQKYPNTRIAWTNIPPRQAFSGGANPANTTNEYWRRDFNAWLHNTRPMQIDEVVDIDTLLTDASTTATPQLRAYYTTEQTHFTVRAHDECSAVIPLERAS